MENKIDKIAILLIIILIQKLFIDKMAFLTIKTPQLCSWGLFFHFFTNYRSGGEIMFYKRELEEMIDQGLVKDTVNVVRKNGQIFDVVLDGEPVKDDEVVTVERVEDLLGELSI